jgi:hypothetical protein
MAAAAAVVAGAPRFRVIGKRPKDAEGETMPPPEDAAPLVKRFRVTGKASKTYAALREEMGIEDGTMRQYIYLVTVSRVIPDRAEGLDARSRETLSRKQLAEMIRDSFQKPVASASGGRPRTDTAPLVNMAVVCRASSMIEIACDDVFFSMRYVVPPRQL